VACDGGGSAERSSRGPDGVVMIFCEIPVGRGDGAGGLGEGVRHWRVKGPKGIVEISMKIIAKFKNEAQQVWKFVFSWLAELRVNEIVYFEKYVANGTRTVEFSGRQKFC
jgi:hypothetical protein